MRFSILSLLLLFIPLAIVLGILRLMNLQTLQWNLVVGAVLAVICWPFYLLVYELERKNNDD